jgi:hypothetical protein
MNESRAEFEAFRSAITAEIKPLGTIEQLYADDFIHITWEILRLRRMKVALLNKAFLPAIELLLQHMEVPESEVKEVALRWVMEDDSKKEFVAHLNEIGLDESAIQAEAFRIASRDVDQLERLLMSLEWRRSKALSFLATYRQSIAVQLKQNSDRIIEGTSVISLVNRHRNKPAA